jgi:hypothetical protein
MSNFFNKSQLEYSNSDDFLEIFGFINNLIKLEPEISPNEVYDKLVYEGELIDPDSDEFPIHFGEANMIDRIFFGTGGSYWLNAFGRPHEGIKFIHNDITYVASNCGIFTCDIEKYYEHDENSSWETTSSLTVNEQCVPEVYNSQDNLDNLDDQSEKNEDEYEEDLELILAESKEFANELKNFIETRLIGEPDIKPWEMFEIIKSHYPEFGISRRLCFNDAFEIDKHIYNRGGAFWRTAYNLPKESESIIVFGNQCEAVQVGIFTFNA